MQLKANSSDPRPASRLIQLFVARAGLGAAVTPEKAMNALIGRFRRKCRGASTSMQRMQFFLKSRKVRSVETIRELQCDGMLEPIGVAYPAGFKILLKKQTSAERLRFTVAHEICHTFFYELVPELKFVPHEPDPMEERLCDFGAAELLMPTASIKRAARPMAICLESLRRLAGEYSVSLTAMFLRLRSLGLWNCEFSEWHRMTNGNFVLEHFYGGKSLPWEWEDTSILSTSWQSRKAAFGHTFVRYEDQRGKRYYKPTRFEVRRFRERMLALWGAEIEPPLRVYPLLDGPYENDSPLVGASRAVAPLNT